MGTTLPLSNHPKGLFVRIVVTAVYTGVRGGRLNNQPLITRWLEKWCARRSDRRRPRAHPQRNV